MGFDPLCHEPDHGLTAVDMMDLDGRFVAKLSYQSNLLQPFGSFSHSVLKKMMTLFNREVPCGSNICTD